MQKSIRRLSILFGLGNKGDSQCPWSCIPSEILALIFQYLVVDCESSIDQSLWDEFENHEFTGEDLNLRAFVSGQARLSATLLVCRSWYVCGAKALYSKPAVRSAENLHLLERTLRRRPVLAQLVRCVEVFNLSRNWPRTTLWEGLMELVVRKEKRKRKRYRKDLRSVIDKCVQIHSLGIRTAVFEKPISFDLHLITPSRSHNLRRLSLHGKWLFSHSMLSPDIELPLLEDLSLESFSLHEDSRWPNFPSLRRIRISDCGYFSTPGRMPILPVGLPFLAEVELSKIWSNDSYRDIVDVLYTYSETLQSLQMGGVWMATASLELEYSRFTSLKRLILEPDELWPGFFLPQTVAQAPALEVLFILMCVPIQYGVTQVTETTLLERMSIHLGVGESHAKSFPKLKTLFIEGDLVAWGCNGPDSVKLKNLCDSRGIDLTLNLYDFAQDGFQPLFTKGVARGWRWQSPLGLLGMLLNDI
ncbi:hypothetical protein JAAARDRAFT_40850 [Jaapia argillacea MUCL 33604]|uniref:F-box domain-containing protein n=1 Tax=Jaapia argillacea MUCL 33604 TaxID=933084 RepID=A0A067PCR5_9AGAM|nr:hypothetical protein JAAARDRAFT_40850 [Jaapia argillacea MUCL 33604]